jgi:hypothetical protein
MPDSSTKQDVVTPLLIDRTNKIACQLSKKWSTTPVLE